MQPFVAVEKRYECVFVVLGMQHAMYKELIVVCSLSGPTVFLNIISKTA